MLKHKKTYMLKRIRVLRHYEQISGSTLLPNMAPVVVWGPKVKVVHPHGYDYAGIRKRVTYQIEKHTTTFVRCLKHPKPRVESNASLYKAGHDET
jgi:hypothetical protein